MACSERASSPMSTAPRSSPSIPVAQTVSSHDDLFSHYPSIFSHSPSVFSHYPSVFSHCPSVFDLNKLNRPARYQTLHHICTTRPCDLKFGGLVPKNLTSYATNRKSFSNYTSPPPVYHSCFCIRAEQT